MAYPKRVYTDGVEEVSYVDMNRIETGIETNDLAIAKINSDNIARDKEISSKETTTGAQNKADTALKSAKEYADGKVKLNGSTTNVNFKKNEIVQDGLVIDKVIDNSKDFTIQSLFEVNTMPSSTIILVANRTNTVAGFAVTTWKETETTIGVDVRTYGTQAKTTIVKSGIKLGSHTIVISRVGNVFRCTVDDTTKEVDVSSMTPTKWVTVFSQEVKWNACYNRPLTPQEIQHNFSVLNNTPAISSIETTDKTSFLIGSDTDHVMTRTGHTEEERHTALLSKFGKKFTSTGEDITVENGIETQRVLSAKISGQTVKNYVFEELFGNNIYYGVEGNEITVKQTDGTAWNNKKYINVESGEYAFICDKNVIIDSTDIGAISLKANEASYKSITQPFRLKLLPGANAMPFKCKFAIVKKGEEAKINLGTLQFGLNSTQAIITNNGLKYSFYKDATDKASGTVIPLGGVNGVYDTLEIKKDGSGIYTQNTMERVLYGSEDWAFASDDGIIYRFFLLRFGMVWPSTTSIVRAISDKFNWIGSGARFLEGFGGYDLDGRIYLNLHTDKLSTKDVAGFKAWLSSNPVTVRYQLMTPIVTYIPKELMSAIFTQLKNEFHFGDAVKPSSVEITVPVDKLAEHTQEIDGLQKTVLLLQQQVAALNTK